MGLEFEDILKKSFTLWNRDSQTWKYVLGVYAVTITFLIIIGIVLFALFGPIVSEVLANPSKVEDPGFLVGMMPTIISNLLIFILVLVPLILLEIIIIMYLYTLVHLRALQLNGLETDSFSVGKYIRLIALLLATLPIAFTSLHDKKIIILFYLMLILYIPALLFTFISPFVGIVMFGIMVLVGIINGILIIIGLWKTNRKFLALWISLWIIGIIGVLISFINQLLGLLFIFIALLLGAVLIIVVIYHFYRLSLSISIFLHKNIPILEATKTSWSMTKGNVLMIFIIGLVVGIAVGIINMIVQFVGQFFGGIFDFLLGTFFLSTIFTFLIAFIAGPILRLPVIYTLPTIYAQLIKPSAPPPKQSQPVTQAKQTSGSIFEFSE